MKLRQIETDQDAAIGGVWSTFALDFEVKVAKWRNREFLAFVAERRDELPDDADDESAALSKAVSASKMLCECIAQTIIRDWRGLEGDDGEPVPYSPEKAAELLGNPAYEDFTAWVVEQSMQRSRFSADRRARDLGKSKPSSDGSGGSAPSSADSEPPTPDA